VRRGHLPRAERITPNPRPPPIEREHDTMAMRNLSHRPATFTEANAWVHLSPENFARLFPHVTTIWQTEDGRVVVETDGTSELDLWDLAYWEQEAQRSGEPVLPCGCWVRVHYVPHARKTLCRFWNPTTGFFTKLRISAHLMLSAGCLSDVKDALCAHPHDEQTFENALEAAAERVGHLTSEK
jgi:hypothetical protein